MFVKVGMPLWTGRISCLGGRSKEWAWLACFTIGKHTASGNDSLTVGPEPFGKIPCPHRYFKNIFLKNEHLAFTV